jgi:sterol desaturase/sphingolipid hydroxylase (fatty acid hydroxylase superfamily)
MELIGGLVELFNIKGVLIAALIFIPLERVFAMHAGQKVFRRGWGNDLIYMLFNGVVIKLGLAVLLFGVMILSGWLVPRELQASVAAQPLWLQSLQVIVVADLGFYAVHRLFHAIPWLWAFHQIHHSIEELDWLAAARVHPVDQILTKAGSLIPVFALGFSEGAIVVFAVLYQWQSALIHANVRVNVGPLRWLLASPEFHHWHHSNDRTVRDKNFAGQLPLWDAIFGTLHLPRGQVPGSYGIDEPLPATYAAQLLHPFRTFRRENSGSSQVAQMKALAEIGSSNPKAGGGASQPSR